MMIFKKKEKRDKVFLVFAFQANTFKLNELDHRQREMNKLISFLLLGSSHEQTMTT